MSNLLYMDESNGNGVYASNKHMGNNTTAATTATNNSSNCNSHNTVTANNINNIITGGGGAAAAATVVVAAPTAATLPTSVSNEDLSQSLSEYTDADESISAPTEFLAEFLSAVMLKDYKKALKYCKLILQYEPNNATAKEFYPLILDKLRGTASSDSDENYNKSSSPEMVLELHSSDRSGGESDEIGSDEQQVADCEAMEGVEVDGMEEGDGYEVPEDNSSGEPHSQDSNLSSSCGLAGRSLSESVDEDDEDDDVDADDIDVEDCDVGEEEDNGEDDEDVASSSGDDLPIDDSNLLGDGSVGDDGGGGAACNGSGSHSSRNSSSGGEGRSRSDNTTHSYSSLLLEEEDDIVPVNLQFSKELSQPDLDVSNGNKVPSTSCSDSESPTEPLTQRLAAILLSKCGVTTGSGTNQ